jgi:peptidoglycan-associated lipoprotein
MPIVRPAATAVFALAAGALALGGCASEKYVRDHVAVVDGKADATQGQVNAQGQQIQTHDAHLAQLDQNTKEALDRANAANKLAEGKFLYSVVLQDDSVKFPVEGAKLSSEAQTRLNDLAQKLKTDNRNVYLEIQGHADAHEPGAMPLGEKRAEAVRRYLMQQGVPLNRMSTISYGKEEPATTERGRQARAQNRRVVVVVLS